MTPGYLVNQMHGSLRQPGTKIECAVRDQKQELWGGGCKSRETPGTCLVIVTQERYFLLSKLGGGHRRIISMTWDHFSKYFSGLLQALCVCGGGWVSPKHWGKPATGSCICEFVDVTTMSCLENTFFAAIIYYFWLLHLPDPSSSMIPELLRERCQVSPIN